MFACLFLPLPASAPTAISGGLEEVAREVSPRVEIHKPGLVTLDARGLDRLLGAPREIGVELQRGCAVRHLPASVTVAGTRTAAMLLAVSAPGLAVVAAGDERRRVSPLPLGCLPRILPPDGCEGVFGRRQDLEALLALLARWGLKTLGDLARLPEAPLAARLGPAGARWQRVARGEDLEPLVSSPPEAPIEERLDLDWPVEGLEPLSFVLARVLDPIAQRLDRRDEAAVVLLMTFRLASHEIVTRRIELPAPMRDPKVLRTLVLLHLESHPLGEGVDRVAIRVEPARAPVTQFSLLSRALPFPEQIATLVARLSALAGERAVGAPALIDSHRPGAFTMGPFAPATGRRRPIDSTSDEASPGVPEARVEKGGAAPLALRRFRLPIAARVMEKDHRPVRVTTERRGLRGGAVEQAVGPWRTSGEWWGGGMRNGERRTENGERRTENGARGFDRDEWDVALADGAVYRVFQDRATERWFVDGILD
jgi:protein ImuB